MINNFFNDFDFIHANISFLLLKLFYNSRMLISVIIPTFNMANSIEHTLNSLENQTYQQFEVLIVDDGSSDNTSAVVKPYLARHKNWQYFKKTNGHWGSVINYVLQNNLINGDYVTILDADDWYFKSAFAIVFQKIKQYPQIDFLITDSYNWFEKTGKKHRIYNAPFRSRFLDKKQAINPWVRQLGKFYRASLFKKLPILREKVDFNDVIIHAFLINQAQSSYYISKPLACYRSDNEQSLTRWQDNPTHKNWSELFSSYEIADQFDDDNREIAGILIMNLWYFRKKIRAHIKNNYQLPKVQVKAQGIKFKWLPWYIRFLPLKTYFKFITRKWWTERVSASVLKQGQKITVIVPVYNVGHVVTNSLLSLEKQTNQNFEVLIINDGSTDNSQASILPFLERNPNWQYFKKTNGHWGSVINYVLKNNLINGDYVTILDADDWFAHNAIEEVNKQLNSDPKIDVILSKVILQTKNRQIKFPVILFRSKYVKSSAARTPLSTPHGKFYDTNLFKKMLPLKEGVPYQDTILYHELISHAQRIYYINKPLSTWWFDRPENSTQSKWNESRINLWLENIEMINKSNSDQEIAAFSLMYLWELKRQIKHTKTRKIKLNTKKIKFKWIPLYIRMFLPIKTYFKIKTRQFIDKDLD